MSKDRLVFDCNVYLQFLLNRDGPAGRCVVMALEEEIELFVCPEVIQEIQELPRKEIGVESGLTSANIYPFVEELLEHATFIRSVPAIYAHPIDPDDSVYVNLALAAQANMIVSNDNHLLNLTNPAKPWSQDFRQRFQDIQVFKPAEYLEYCRRRERQQQGQ